MTRILFALAILLTSLPALAQPERRSGDGVHLRILRSYHLPEGMTAREPIVVIGGSATIDGRAEGDVVVIGGTLRVGPTGVVLGDVVTVGGDAEIDPAATIDGRVESGSVRGPDVDFGWGWEPWHLTRGFWATAALGATLLRLGLTLLVALFVAAVAPAWLRGLSDHTSASPGIVATVGLAGELLIVPLTLVLVIALVMSVVGIPLLLVLPFAMAGAAAAWTAGFAAVAALLGSALRRAPSGQSGRPVLDVLVGFFLISVATVLAHVAALGPAWATPFSAALGAAGLLIEYAAWTLGLGAVVLAAWNGRTQSVPPPMPAPSVV